MAENSSLSRWAEQAVVKGVRFHLKLDDPTLAQERWVELSGDRTQLEDLRHTINTYVQNFLDQSQDFLHPSVTLTDPGNSQTAITSATEAGEPLLPSDRHSNPREISVQPNGWLGHDLSLGNLATEESGSVIRLSTLQLFDLATALDDYSADLLELPTLPKTGWFRGRENWAQVAAIAVAVVGLSASALKLLDSSVAPTAKAPTLSQSTSSNDQRIATQIPPAVLDHATPPVISAEKLPPIPPVGVTPKIGIPTLAPTPQPGEVANPTLPSSKSLPQNSIATVPITGIPGRPTIISGEANSSAPSQKVDSAAASLDTAALASGQVAAAPAGSPSSRSALRGSDRPTSATAFDTIPQVAEARTYFQQRWKPPEGLTQTLEYSLVLAPNGSIQSIIPLRQLSGDYIDRTGMPLVGDPFVSALSNERNAKIRLVLTTDGKVQTFLEPN
jgi:hypothetical protein